MMKIPRIEVAGGQVVDIHGGYAHIFDWDAFEMGEPFVCPVCDKEYGDIENAESIVRFGKCQECIAKYGQEDTGSVFLLSISHRNGDMNLVCDSYDTAYTMLCLYVAEHWEEEVGEPRPSSIGEDEIRRYMEEADETYYIDEEPIYDGGACERVAHGVYSDTGRSKQTA